MDKERREQLVGRQAPWSRAVRKGYDSNDTVSRVDYLPVGGQLLTR